MAMVGYSLEDHVAVVTLNHGENRFNPDFLDAFLAVLDAVENQTDATTLVVHSSHEKIFSNGIDLEWLVPVIERKDVAAAKSFFRQLNRVFIRMLEFPAVTVAAVNGHVFAGGAILACTFDFRFMRSGRGFFCLPEVDLGIPFLPGMNAILGRAIPRYQLEYMELTGARLTAEACEAHHIVLKASPIETLMDEVMTFARGINKKRETIQELKKRLNRRIVRTIENEDAPYIDSGIFHIG